jgi:hypothetical protein
MDQKIPGLDNVALAVEPKARNATTTADMLTVDLKNVNAAEAIVAIGTWTDGVHTFSLLESNDDSTYTAVAAASMDGTFAQVTSAALDQMVQNVGYRGTARYIKVKCTVSGATTGLVWGAVVARGLKTYRS